MIYNVRNLVYLRISPKPSSESVNTVVQYTVIIMRTITGSRAEKSTATTLCPTVILTPNAIFPPFSQAQNKRYLRSSQPKPPHTPLILLANCMSFCIIVTRLACIAHRFVSSNRCTRNASAASCNAMIACDCQRGISPVVDILSATSRTNLENGNLSSRRSVLF